MTQPARRILELVSDPKVATFTRARARLLAEMGQTDVFRASLAARHLATAAVREARGI